jgi:hypothetical protein
MLNIQSSIFGLRYFKLYYLNLTFNLYALKRHNSTNLSREIYDNNSEVYLVKPICFFYLMGAFHGDAIKKRLVTFYFQIGNLSLT